MRQQGKKYFFLVPSVCWILVFTIFPLVYAARLSFFSFRLGRGMSFIGGRNYLDVFNYSRFWNSLLTTFLIVAVSVSIETGLGLLLALHFGRQMPGNRIFRSLLSMPLFATPVAVGFLGLTIFYERYGPANLFMSLFGLQVPWLSNTFWAKMSVIILDTWIWTPFCFLVFLAGVHSIPEEMYEVAYLDTQSTLKIFRFITLPLLSPLIGIIVVLRLIEALKIFGLPYSLTTGGPGTATEVYPILVYRMALKHFDFGYASALGFVFLAIVMTIVITFFKRLRRIYE